MNRKRQRGMHVTEMAFVGLLISVLMLASIEFARALFTWNAAVDATRRGARVAAVCQMNNPAIKTVAVYGTNNATGRALVPGLTTSNITVTYLDGNGNSTATFTNVKYVRVGITGYQFHFFIPGLPNSTVTLPSFQTTLPAESLGYDPDNNTWGCFFPP